MTQTHAAPLPKTLALLVCALLAASPALAADVDLRPGAVFVEVGGADRRTTTATAGLAWPWAWRGAALGGELTGTTELFASHWSARAASGRESYTLLGLVPLLRLRFGQGTSPWFVEGGIGISVLDGVLRTPAKQFSTAANFYDALALGYSLGPDRKQEVSLRLTHVSNGNLKRPNPGENFLQLRYAVKF